MRRTPFVPTLALLFLTVSAFAQSPPNALLSQSDTQLTPAASLQLMESTATIVPV